MDDEPQPVTKPKRRRRWLQFSLRSLLLFTVVVAFASAWLGRRIEQKRKERLAAAVIRSVGGWVHFDYEFDASGAMRRQAEPPGPKWLRSWLGDDFFARADRASLHRFDDDASIPLEDLPDLRSLQIFEGIKGGDLFHITSLHGLEELFVYDAKDAELPSLKPLSKLRQLSLISPQVTNAGIENIGGLSNLEILELPCVKLTDAGLQQLKSLPRLKTLNLAQSRITGAGLACLAASDGLETLSLSSTRLDDAGMANLRLFPNIESLDLAGTDIGDDGLANLENLRQMRSLSIGQMGHVALHSLGIPLSLGHETPRGGARITDAGIAHLAGLTKLESLRLTGIKLSDAGLAHLANLKQLQTLELSGTRVTSKGLAGLTQMPQLKSLNLANTDIDDDGLRLLGAITSLERLDLRWTDVSDDGLPALIRLSRLRTLLLEGTEVGNKGWKALHQALAMCEITW